MQVHTLLITFMVGMAQGAGFMVSCVMFACAVYSFRGVVRLMQR